MYGYYYREKVHVNQFDEKIIQKGRREKNYPEVSPKSLTTTNEYLDWVVALNIIIWTS